MIKFEVGKRVNIVSGEHAGESGIVTGRTIGQFHAAHTVVLDGEHDGRTYLGEDLEYDDMMDMEIDDLNRTEESECDEDFDDGDMMNCEIDDVFFEMATIARNKKEHLLISVNPEREHLNIAYFKVYDNESVNKSQRVARLHFKDSGMEYHKRDRNGKLIWDIGKDAIEEILRIMREENADAPGYTNWQYACYRWNYENDLIDAGYQKYFAGDYDAKYKDIKSTSLQEAYIPSTQEMPGTWIYG